MTKKKLSLTYKFLRRLGFNYSEEEYGQVSLLEVIKQSFKNIRIKLLQKMMDWVILEPINPRRVRPALIRRMGAKVGKNVFVGAEVYIDGGHAHLITIEDYVHITARCLLLCHQRDLTHYRVGDNAAKLGYQTGKIYIAKGVMIGMNTVIMPGVTIGEGAIVGAGSLVTKDIPSWTIAAGRPARVIKHISSRN